MIAVCFASHLNIMVGIFSLDDKLVAISFILCITQYDRVSMSSIEGSSLILGIISNLCFSIFDTNSYLINFFTFI